MGKQILKKLLFVGLVIIILKKIKGCFKCLFRGKPPCNQGLLKRLKDDLKGLRLSLESAKTNEALKMLILSSRNVFGSSVSGSVKVLKTLKDSISGLKENLGNITTAEDAIKRLENLLNTTKDLLPSQQQVIQAQLDIIMAIRGIPSDPKILDEIIGLTDDIISKLEGLC